MQSSKGKHAESVRNSMASLDAPSVDRCQLKGNLNIIGFFEITSSIGFRRVQGDSHAAVVTQLVKFSLPKLALAAAFECVKISPSV